MMNPAVEDGEISDSDTERDDTNDRTNDTTTSDKSNEIGPLLVCLKVTAFK